MPAVKETASSVKHLLLFLALAAVLVAGCWLLLHLSGPVHRINMESYDAIKGGMTEKEVEHILGVPAGDYSTQTVYLPACGMGLPYELYGPLERRKGTMEWLGNQSWIYVSFDHDGRVIAKSYTPVWCANRNWLEKVRDWWGL